MSADEPSSSTEPSRPHRRRLIAVVLAILVVLAAGVAVAVIRHDSPKSLAAFSDDPLVTCGGDGPAFHASRLHGPVGAEHADEPAAQAFLADLKNPNGPPTNPGGPPIASWRLVVQTKSEALFIGGDVENRQSDTYERSNGTWRWKGSGGCNVLALAQPGLSTATMVLDTRRPITPSTTELHLFVQGNACNGGINTPKSQIVGPQVHVDAQRIVVTTAVRESSGAHTCQGAIGFAIDGTAMPSGSEVVVKLPAPVGDKSVLDGSRFPYAPIKTWGG